MSHQPPCTAWAEKLVLRYEDLSPADRADLQTHIKICPACEAAQADYHFLDVRLRALPPPVMKPFPRLSFPGSVTEAAEKASRRTPSASRFSDVAQRAMHSRPFPSFIKKALAGILIACLTLTLLLAFQSRSINTSVAHQPGATLLTYDQHTFFVDAVAWSPNGRYLASGSWDHSVRVWDAKTGALLFAYQHNEVVAAVAWSPDGRYIASASWDNTVQVWDVQKQRLYRTYTGHNGLVTTLSWSPDSRSIASGGWDDTVQVWDVQTGQLHFTYPYNESVDAVAWSPNGSYIAIGGKDEDVHILDALTGRQIFDYTGHAFQYTGQVYQCSECVVNAVAWSPDSKAIASGDRSGVVQVWEATTGKLITTYTGHTADVFAVTWSPDGRYIASGGVDHTVQIWQAQTGLQLVTYKGHRSDVAAVAWSPDGRYIASGGWDDTVQIWQATYGG